MKFPQIDTDYTVNLQLDPDAHDDISVNDRIWPAYAKGQLILPSGSHTIKPIKKSESLTKVFKTTARLVDISGELVSCKMIAQGLEMSYHSPIRNYIVLNENPRTVYLDGQVYETDIYHGLPGYSIKLPSGSHTVKVHTQSGSIISLKNVSIVTSVTIVLISTLAGGMLAMLYIKRYRSRRRLNNHNNSVSI